jgi:hypothetical protein
VNDNTAKEALPITIPNRDFLFGEKFKFAFISKLITSTSYKWLTQQRESTQQNNLNFSFFLKHNTTSTWQYLILLDQQTLKKDVMINHNSFLNNSLNQEERIQLLL